MPEPTITDKIDLSKSEQYTLSIRLNTDGFSFSVYNPVHHTIYYVKKRVDPAVSLTANIKQVVKETDFLNTAYKQVNVLMAEKRFTFVPLELFDEEQIETFFYYNHNLKENEIVSFNVPKRNNIVILFGIEKSIYNFLNDQFNPINFYSRLSPLTEYFAIESKKDLSRKMYAYLKKNSVDIYCFDRGSLLLANSYECRDESDRQYYILYVWKQLNMDQQTDALQLVGNSVYVNKNLSGLKRFIKDISSIEHTSEVPFDMSILLSQNS